jgi:mannose-6-phosphate isomerase-like protein (cupin superfamily)
MPPSPTSGPLPNHFTQVREGLQENILGVSHIYKASAAETNGTMICVEIAVPAGHGIPLHKHTREDESFYVLEGEIVIQGEGLDQPVRLSPGAFFYGPRGRRHSFSNPGPAGARLLVFATPGANLESMFGELAVLTAQGPTPEKVDELCGRYGVFFAPAAP